MSFIFIQFGAPATPPTRRPWQRQVHVPIGTPKTRCHIKPARKSPVSESQHNERVVRSPFYNRKGMAPFTTKGSQPGSHPSRHPRAVFPGNCLVYAPFDVGDNPLMSFGLLQCISFGSLGSFCQLNFISLSTAWSLKI